MHVFSGIFGSFLLILLCLASAMNFANAQELPSGAEIVAGDVRVNASSGRMEIDQASSTGIVNWDSFNIGSSSRVVFVQPNKDAVTLNRVVGINPSLISGTLTANGTVVLVNPDGILFDSGSVVDVGGLLATTADISNSDFLAANYLFKIPGRGDASVVNNGNISASDAGFVALVAPGVRNSGTITANLGKVTMASGNGFNLDLYGDNLINLSVSDEVLGDVVDLETGITMQSSVDNSGHLKSDGGRIAMDAVTAKRVVDQVINNTGVIEASSVDLKNGKIVLSAQTQSTKVQHAPSQKVTVSGELRASGTDIGETGGQIEIVGEDLSLQNATIVATGDAGGGTVLIGGDYMGGNPKGSVVAHYNIPLEAQPIPTARNLTVDQDTVVDASAISRGHGGKIVNWSDGKTTFDGTIRSRGGAESGDGGFVEVSGLEQVEFADLDVDLIAPNGLNGTILFDPSYLRIGSASAAAIENTINSGGNPAFSAGKIEVASNIFKSSAGNSTLSFFGDDGVEFATGITIGSFGGPLNIVVNANSDLTASTTSPNGGVPKFRAGDELGAAQLARGIDVGQKAAAASDPTLVYSLNYSGTLSKLAEILSAGGYLSAAGKKEFESSVFQNGATLKLNGGTLSVKDNQGTAQVRIFTNQVSDSDGNVVTYYNSAHSTTQTTRRSFNNRPAIDPEWQRLLQLLEEYLDRVNLDAIEPSAGPADSTYEDGVGVSNGRLSQLLTKEPKLFFQVLSVALRRILGLSKAVTPVHKAAGDLAVYAVDTASNVAQEQQVTNFANSILDTSGHPPSGAALDRLMESELRNLKRKPKL